MTIPNSSWTQILSTSLQNRSKQISDAVSKRNALYGRLRKKGNVLKLSGGESIVRAIEYALNNTYTRYTNAQKIKMQPYDFITSMQAYWKQVAMTIQQTGLEDIENAGPEQLIDLLKTKQRNTEKAFVIGQSGDLYSDGSADSGLQVDGLQKWVADAPTASATVGGIPQATNTFWQNVSKTTSSATEPGFGARSDATNIRQQVESMYLAGVRDGASFDLVVSDNSLWQYYTQALRAIQEISLEKDVSDGILSLRLFGADYIYDGGADGQCPSARMYFLDTDTLYYVISSKRDFVALPGDRQPIDQDLSVKLLVWAGNLICTNRRGQAVMVDA